MQSEEYSEKREGLQMDMGKNSGDIDVQRSRLFFGENVRSLRTLLRRSNLIDVTAPTTSSTNLGYWRVAQTRFPPYYGYDPGGINFAKGITAPAFDFAFNYVSSNPWNFVANCFVGQRGSMHWHYNWQGPSVVTMRATRNTNGTPSTTMAYVGAASGSIATNAKNLISNVTASSGATALVNQVTNAGLSISVPNYSVFKFESTDPLNSTRPTLTGGRYDGSYYEGVNIELNNNGPVQDLDEGRLERYASIGTDYSLYFFLNCPSLVYYPISAIVPL
jgi:hypothetical protein